MATQVELEAVALLDRLLQLGKLALAPGDHEARGSPQPLEPTRDEVRHDPVHQAGRDGVLGEAEPAHGEEVDEAHGNPSTTTVPS